MNKPLKRDVDRAHDAWGTAAGRWGDDNLETVRKVIAYHDLRKAWEAATGRTYNRGNRRA